MDIKIFKLLNKARNQPHAFCDMLSEISFVGKRAKLGGEEWDSELSFEDITALKSGLRDQWKKLS